MTHNVWDSIGGKQFFFVMNETNEMFASVHVLNIVNVSLPENRTPVCTFLPHPD
jgi:hypothetical protein